MAVKEGRIPDDWKYSLLIPIYKDKGQPLFVVHTQGSNCYSML